MATPSTIAGTASSKAAQVYETLRRQILDGAYEPGERLRLSPIARALNVSEMPVREALRLLQREALVVIHLNRGAEVARLSLDRGLELIEARMTLETAAAVAAVGRHDAASLAELQRLLLEMERAATRPARFAVKNRAFCTALFARCDNAFMRQLIEDLWDQVWQASSVSIFELMRSRVGQTVEENRAILAALQAGSARRLGSVMARRMRNTMAAWRAAMTEAAAAPGVGRGGIPVHGGASPRRGNTPSAAPSGDID